MNAFDELIDREIDTLFTPAGPSSVSVAPEPEAKIYEPPAKKLKPEAAKPASAAFSTAPAQHPESAPQTVPLPPFTLELDESTVKLEPTGTSDSQQSELQSCLDAANAAYLSLDWEFTAENARKYESAVAKLEPYARKSNAATSLYKMLQATARRIKSRPDQAGREVTEFFRDAHELLSPVLLGQGPLSGWERDKIKNLIQRFKTMRQKPLTPIEEVSPGAAPFQPSVSQVLAQPRVPAAVPSPFSAELDDARSLKGFREWMEQQRSRADEGIAHVCEETRHLSEIEEVLARTSALAPLTARLTRIRKNLEEYVSTGRQMADEWPSQLSWLGRLESNFNLLIDLSSSSPDLKVPSVVSPAPQAPPSQGVETRRERLCIFTLSGKTLGVPASNVVKVIKTSPKKAFHILSRGHASLQDFASLFGSLKSGLGDTWKALPSKTLKNLRFVPIRCELLDEAPEPHPVGGAILVGLGPKYGLIFTDVPAVQFKDDAEIIIDGTTGKDVLGFILTEHGVPIEILNLDNLMEDMD